MTAPLKRFQRQVGRRSRQILDLWRTEGASGISLRARRVAAERLLPEGSVAMVRPADVMAADLAERFQPATSIVLPNQSLTANWVTTPPSPGSGGHTTLFRMVRYLEAHGYQNRVYFYDVYRGDPAYYKSIVRDYYNFHGPVANVEDGMEDADIVFATGWPTAYAVYNSRCAGKRFYFLQDFEPHFYPVGSTSLLAENTYRMGFHGLSIGRCFADKLRDEYGMTVESFRYGCDTKAYRRDEHSRRTGIVFYARRESARRGFELGLMVLEILAARRPDLEIHIYGDKLGRLPFRYIEHGHITPEKINAIYNRCYAGLSLSFTNVSLVALEMLASGCIPVVNDTAHVRTDLDNPYPRYTSAYPQALASALEAVCTRPDFEEFSRAASASVRGTSWDDAGATVDGVIRRALRMDAETNLRHETTESSFEDELVPGIEVRV